MRCVSVFSQCRLSLSLYIYQAFPDMFYIEKQKHQKSLHHFLSILVSHTSVVKNDSIWILEQQAGGNAQRVVKYSLQADRQYKLYNPDLKEREPKRE